MRSWGPQPSRTRDTTSDSSSVACDVVGAMVGAQAFPETSQYYKISSLGADPADDARRVCLNELLLRSEVCTPDGLSWQLIWQGLRALTACMVLKA